MSLSIVLCTYNGARFLRPQLDSLVQQTLQPDEILVQDDGSSDETRAIVEEYAANYGRTAAHPELPYIHFEENPGPKHGVNANFFSALRSAKGDIIAICDQDDIWELTKLEHQMAALGDHLLIGGISQPFSDDPNAPVDADMRLPNIDLLRMLFVGMMPGHTQLFRRELLDQLPECEWFMYDLQIQALAAALERVTYLPEVVVHQRRHLSAATYVAPRNRQRSLSNALQTLVSTLGIYRKTRPHIRHRFTEWQRFLDQIPTETPAIRRAKRLAHLLVADGPMAYLQLTRFCYCNRLRLFHTVETDGLLTKLRALYFPIFCSTYYRYLIGKT